MDPRDPDDRPAPTDPVAETGARAREPVSEAAAAAAAGADATSDEAAPASVVEPERDAPAPPRRRRSVIEAIAEHPETPVELPSARLRALTRRDFLIFTAGAVATAAAAWWLLPDRTRSRLLPAGHDRLDTLAARVGLTNKRRERLLDGALDFDDDVAEALYSANRRVRTYRRSDVTALKNNYNGRTPSPGYLGTWSLAVSGLASGAPERVTLERLLALPRVDQVTRLVCVEGWSAIAWWSGVRFADVLAALPPAPDARWAALRSGVNLDPYGRPDPYYVSIDLDTARHPQTLLATHQNGRPLSLGHGAPLRLVVPMKLGLKNIKAITEIAYTRDEPADYWNERGYSRYDGL
jgi:DMSO/TMAO reductase YedYZ molybdopterin-dependent catalytic subunit